MTTSPVRSNRYSDAASLDAVKQGEAAVKRGQAGESVAWLQSQLNKKLPKEMQLKEDGLFGPKTQAALKWVQSQVNQKWQPAEKLAVDGALGKKTISAISSEKYATSKFDAPRLGTGQEMPTPAEVADEALSGRSSAKEGKANIKSYFSSGQNQGASGEIVVNGHTYRFNSGGNGTKGKGYIPRGTYTVGVDANGANGSTQHVDGYGYSYSLLKNGKDNGIKDPRTGFSRGLFRVHPDGGGKGTIGCIGIVGDRATQERFNKDLQTAVAAARRAGKAYTITVA